MMVHTKNNGILGSSGRSEDGYARDSNKGVPKKQKPLGPKECKIKLLKLVGGRDYSTSMMWEKLSKAGFEDSVISETIEYAVNSKLLNDARYAEMFIASKKSLGWGQKKIEIELGNRGVSCEILSGYPEEYFSEDVEIARAVDLLRTHNTSAKDVRASHYRYLLSKGFSPTIASKAIKRSEY